MKDDHKNLETLLSILDMQREEIEKLKLENEALQLRLNKKEEDASELFKLSFYKMKILDLEEKLEEKNKRSQTIDKYNIEAKKQDRSKFLGFYYKKKNKLPPLNNVNSANISLMNSRKNMPHVNSGTFDDFDAFAYCSIYNKSLTQSIIGHKEQVKIKF